MKRVRREDIAEALEAFDDTYWPNVGPKVKRLVRKAFVAGYLRSPDLSGDFLPADTAGSTGMVLVHEDYCGYPGDCNCAKYRRDK